MSPEELHSAVDSAIDNIRPYLIADGGNVRIVEITEENEVVLELLGACETCPMSAMTMKAGIEEAIMKAVPSITGVKAINLTELNK